jgi:hypothetical protein
MTIQRVTNTEFDGASTFIVIGTHTIPAIKASYSDKVEKGEVAEMGNQGIAAVTPGYYKPEMGKITFRNSVWRKLFLPLIPIMGSANSPTSIVVSYLNDGIGSDSDLWKPCWYVGSSLSPESSNKAIEVECEFKVLQYFWGDDRKIKNSVAGLVLGLNRL